MKKYLIPISNLFVTISPLETYTKEPSARTAQTTSLTDPPTLTKTATLTNIPCFHFLMPENGAKLKAIGRVSFPGKPC
jgi:hypothetical protein